VGYDCPNPQCAKSILFLVNGDWVRTSVGYRVDGVRRQVLIRPRGTNRPPVPAEVLDEFAEDYREACVVLPDSPKASAALSRRALQHLLREKGGASQKDLAKQIQHVLDEGKLPSYLVESVDGVRNIGNFAAHPTKSSATGEIVAVEPGEAEWNLDTIEALFDFYFVQPAALRAKRDALNKKLRDAGKPQMK
jgi:hypothetical protein